jgi:hypothetical protein
MGVRSGKARAAGIAELAVTLRILTVIRPYLQAIAADDVLGGRHRSYATSRL